MIFASVSWQSSAADLFAISIDERLVLCYRGVTADIACCWSARVSRSILLVIDIPP